MQKNVGGADKLIRIVVGIALIIVGVAVQMGTGLRIGVFSVAGIALVTAFAGL